MGTADMIFREVQTPAHELHIRGIRSASQNQFNLRVLLPKK
jgi:hypothetical protein